MGEDWNNLLIRIEDLKHYIVEFEEDDKKKPKDYLYNCPIGDNNQQSIIIIT